jgi:hypothetical protein
MRTQTKPGTGARKPKPDDPEQSKRFEDTARELCVDETGAAFRRALKELVPRKPSNPYKRGAD